MPSGFALGRHLDSPTDRSTLVFRILTLSTPFTGKISYRSEDMDLQPYPVVHYGAVVVFALAALWTYWLYLAMIFEW